LRLAHFFVTLLVLISVLVIFIFVLIVFFLEFCFVELIELLKLQRFASEPIDGTRDQLLLDVFAELVVEFETLFDIGRCVLVAFGRWFGRGEKVEEGLARNSLADNASLLGV